MDLSIELLRTFVAVVDSGSFTRAASQVHRTQSAVSLQIQRLESSLGHPLFVREVRGVRLSEPGERLLPHARQMLALNDATVAAMGELKLLEEVRLGSSQDLADSELTWVLEQITRTHANALRLRVKIDSSRAIAAACDNGDLELGFMVRPPNGPGERLISAPLVWLSKMGWSRPNGLLPLVLFEPPCAFRDAALLALNSAGIAWEIVFSTPSLTGALAAVRAGIGVTVRTPRALSSGLDLYSGLPPLPTLEVALLRSAVAGGVAVEQVEELVRKSVVVPRDKTP